MQEIEFQVDLKKVLSKYQEEYFIIDSILYKLYKELFVGALNPKKIFQLVAKEKNKNIDTVLNIYEFFLQSNATRNSCIIAIGGGITTDIAAFAASTYKRGCGLILIPTTLLGMVDAAIGGKTGINYENIKNGIGSFYPAEKVIINTDFLGTQLEADYKGGFVEIIKMSFLPTSNLPEMLNNEQNIEEIIKEAIRTKIKLCQQDLHDKSSRRLLNLGHTFGHILESISNYKIPHGAAVAVGIRAAIRFSLKKGFIDSEVYRRIEKRLDKFDLPASFPGKYLPQLLEKGIFILKQDKKADDKLNLVLFKGLQELFFYKTENSIEVISTLQEFADV